MKKLLFFLFLLFYPFKFYSHKIEFNNGKIIEVDSILMRNDSIYTKDEVFLRSEVKSIIFGEGGFEEGEETISIDIQNILKEREKIITKYYDFDGVVMLDKGVNTLLPLGTRKYEYHFRGLILKDSKRSWASFQHSFDPQREKVKIDLARVIKPDGRVISLDMNKIKITKPKAEEIYFTKRRIISFQFPNVEVGDIIEYKYTEEIFNPWDKKIFTMGWFFGGEDPVIESSIRIIVPIKTFIVFKIKNDDSIFIDSLYRDSTKEYYFEKRNTLPPVEEPLMPSIEEIIPFLQLSNQKDWNYIFNWYSDFQKKRMVVTEKVQKLADSLTKDLKTNEEKIASLYHWIQRNIRYISIKGAIASGVSGHTAEQTLENGYGDCTDKAILFSTLLKAIGIEAYPVYLHTHPSPELAKEVPSFWGDHAIVEIFPENGDPYFLDPVSEYSRYPSFPSMDHGVDAICAQKSRIDFIEIPEPERNLREYSYDIEIKLDSFSIVKFHSKYNGSYEAGVRAYWESLDSTQKKNQFEKMIKRISPYAQLLEYELLNLNDISKPLEMTIRYQIPNFLKKQGELYFLKLPELKERYTKDELSLSTRNYDLIYETSEEITHSFKIYLPSQVEILSLPEKISLSNSKVEYSAFYLVKEDTLIFKDVWKRRDKKIKVSEYKEYKNLCNKLLKYVERPIIMKVKGDTE
ncbi:MAG: DUF3857 domain-containing transglutaminase family protein [candidate division WOR-3 bacterium]